VYLTTVILDLPESLWPNRMPVQLQRTFKRRVTACTWGRFAYDLIPWASREYSVFSWAADGGLEVVVGDHQGERTVALDVAVAPAIRAVTSCVVCERSGVAWLDVGADASVCLCAQCCRSKVSLLASVRAMRLERVTVRRR
jgi:hypothetical protein